MLASSECGYPGKHHMVLDIVMADRRVTTRHIASTLGMSQTEAYDILTNDLEMTKVWRDGSLGF